MAIGEQLEHAGLVASHGAAFRAAEDELYAAVEGVHALVVALAPVTRRVIDNASSLQLVIKAGIGTENIDLATARARGIRIARTPGVNLDGVAEYTFGALIALARRLPALDSRVRTGAWTEARIDESGLRPGLRGETLGIVGLGGIGSSMAQIALAFGMTVLASDPFLTKKLPPNVTLTTLDELLGRSRYVSINATLTEETHHLIGERELAIMRPDAILVNASRGSIVDTAALASALEAETIGGAIVDVLEQEPPPLDHPLLRAPNSLLTPHIAGTSANGYHAIGALVVEQLQAFCVGKPIPLEQIVV
jgi:phosphoglycerate dehydrogenase-like enzyme